MRTSHTAICSRIEDEKLKITDEELFTSAAYSAYLTDIAEAASQRYNRKLKVKTYWDETPNARVAFTDNKKITINSGNFLTKSFPTRKLRADSLMGLNAHETGHLLFTDFKLFEIFMQALESGRMYPAEPPGLEPGDETSLAEIKALYAAGDKKAIKVIASAASKIENIIDDIYVEARMCDAFPGSLRTGILLNNLRVPELMPSITKQIENGAYGFAVMVNLLMQHCRSGEVNNLDGYSGEYIDSLYECVPILDKAVYDDDVKTRYMAVNHIIIKLWKYIKPLIDNADGNDKNNNEADDENEGGGGSGDEKSEKNKTDGNDDNGKDADNENKNSGGKNTKGKPGNKSADKILEELSGQIVSIGSKPLGKSRPVIAGKYTRDENSFEKAKEETQALYEAELDRLKLVKTDSISEGTDGSVTYDGEYGGSGSENAAEDIENILYRAAEDKVNLALEDELTAELQEEAKRIRLGNAHRGVHITVRRMKTVSDYYVEEYNKIASPLLLLSKRMQKQVSEILRDKREGGKRTGLYMGKYINMRALINDDKGLFYNKKLPQEKQEIAVAVLNDESGSMWSDDRFASARAASIVIYDFCVKLDIPVMIYGHTSYNNNTELFAYAEFDSRDKKDMYRLMDITYRDNNRDGAALRFVAERLSKRDEEIKLLISISDGQPNDEGYSGTEAEADIRGVKHEYKKRGIIMFAAAIGDDRKNIERIYGDGYLDITDLNRLPVNLAALISKYIKE